MKNIDSKMLEDVLTDYANLYGDQDLLDIIGEWQEKKLGKTPEKVPDYPMTYRQGFGDALGAVKDSVKKLQEKPIENKEYTSGMYDACIEILTYITKKGHEIL